MIDWQDKVDRTTLVCARSGRGIAPGETYISALHYIDDGFVRRLCH